MLLTSVSSDIETSVRIGKTERRSIRWAIGNSVWRPVVSRIPVARDGIEIPLGTDRVRNGWNEEHQRAANRCQDKCFHSNLPIWYRCERLLPVQARHWESPVVRTHRGQMNRREKRSLKSITKFTHFAVVPPADPVSSDGIRDRGN